MKDLSEKDTRLIQRFERNLALSRRWTSVIALIVVLLAGAYSFALFRLTSGIASMAASENTTLWEVLTFEYAEDMAKNPVQESIIHAGHHLHVHLFSSVPFFVVLILFFVVHLRTSSLLVRVYKSGGPA